MTGKIKHLLHEELKRREHEVKEEWSGKGLEGCLSGQKDYLFDLFDYA